MGKVPKKDYVNFSHALFSISVFLTFESEADRLSWNAGNKLPLYAE